MSSAEEIAKRYLVEEYLQQEPDFMSFVEWMDEADVETDEGDIEIHNAVLAILDTVAQRLADEDD